jgi:hypothetical protein
MLAKLHHIISGWANYTFPNEQAEAVAKQRAAVCAKCPMAVFNDYIDVIEFRAVELKGYICSECSCPITKAVRSMEYSCPKNKWHAVGE